MPTVSHIANKIIRESPFLQQAIDKNIVNYANLAEYYHDYIQKELGGKVKHAAIVMAFRRQGEKLESKNAKIPQFDYNSEIIMKTNLVDIGIVRTSNFFQKLKEIYKIINYQEGDVLNIIHGNNEASIVTNEKYREEILAIMKSEKISSIEKDIVSFSLRFNPKFLHTSGVIAKVVKEFAWENINILELVTTNTEMTFIVQKKDVTRTYNLLEGMMKK